MTLNKMIRHKKMENKTDATLKKQDKQRSTEDLQLIVKTMRLPRYLLDELRMQSAIRSAANKSGGKITEQKIIEEALVKFFDITP